MAGAAGAARFALAGAALLLSTTAALAADTLEVWEPGHADLEAYGGWDRLGRPRAERAISGDFVLGFGLTRHVSAYVGVTMAADEELVERLAAPYAGVFATLVDADHLDIDVLLDASVDGPGFSQLQLLPLVEVNLDLLPDRRLLGVFARGSLPVGTGARAPGTDPYVLRPGGLLAAQRDGTQGTTEAAGVSGAAPWRESLSGGLGVPWLPPLRADLGGARRPWPAVNAAAAITLGAYATLADRHQFLVEADLSVTLVSVEVTHPYDVGGLTLGYNVMLAENLELVNSVFLDVPMAGESFAVGVTSGFILAVPLPGR